MAAALPLFCKRVAFPSQRSLKCGETWLKYAARYFASKGSSDPSDNRPFSGTPIGADLDNPVRNTEWEYFQMIRSPEYKKYGPLSMFRKGITREVYSWLHWDVNIDDTEDLVARSKRQIWQRLVEDQKYIDQHHKVLGSDLYAAHMVVARGGAVKFVGANTWISKTEDGKVQLPGRYVDNLHVEGMDISNTQFTYVGFDNFDDLEHLRFIKMHNCEFVDNTCLVKLHRQRESLEFLDLSNCPRITDAGLATLHRLSKLQGLRLTNMTGVKHLGLIALLLEEHLPDLKILGLTDTDLAPPPWEHRGESKLVQALLGMDIGGEEEESTEMKEFSGPYSHDSIAIYPRRIRPVD